MFGNKKDIKKKVKPIYYPSFVYKERTVYGIISDLISAVSSFPVINEKEEPCVYYQEMQREKLDYLGKALLSLIDESKHHLIEKSIVDITDIEKEIK